MRREQLSAHRDFWCPSAGTLVSAYREYELSVVRRIESTSDTGGIAAIDIGE